MEIMEIVAANPTSSPPPESIKAPEETVQGRTNALPYIRPLS
jgi:hypothetical protein